MTKKERIPVVCLECDKKFSTTKVIPECPRCGGVDIEVREVSDDFAGYVS